MGPVQRWIGAAMYKFMKIFIHLMCLLSIVYAAEKSLELQSGMIIIFSSLLIALLLYFTIFFKKLLTVEELVREWSPLVWLAPGEKYFPMDVDAFLRHVHPELPDTSQKLPVYDLNEDPDKYAEYYSKLKGSEEFQNNIYYTNRIKRTYKNLGANDALLPIGESSEKFYLVTNRNIEELKSNKESFIYGKDPNKDVQVPVYAIVTLCTENSIESNIKLKEVDRKNFNLFEKPQSRFIPITSPKGRSLNNKINHEEKVHIVIAETITDNDTEIIESSESSNILVLVNETTKSDIKTNSLEVTKLQEPPNDDIIISKPPIENNINSWITEENDGWRPSSLNTVINYEKPINNDEPIDSFHVTYWMFYPYSQGKMMCSIDLGPLGPIPIPLIFGFCLGTTKEFG